MQALKLQGKCLLAALPAVALASPQNPEQGIPENAVTQVSEHVYAIVGWPNVGIVVGNRATLVIDTGMGARNSKGWLNTLTRSSRSSRASSSPIMAGLATDL